MHIAILSRNPEIYSTDRLVEAAIKRGHEVTTIDVLKVTLQIDAYESKLFYLGEPLPDFDAVIPRIGASVSFYGMAVLRQFEAQGIYTLNTAEGVGMAQDKLLSAQRLAKECVPTPVTAFAHSTEETDHLLELVGGTPAIIKLIEGTQGVGVVLGETPKSARSVIEAFRGAHLDILVQQFIGEAESKDLRVFVVGGQVVAAMVRQGANDDFRSNLHRGGSAEVVELTDRERKVALAAARAIGLEMAGVDLLQSHHGPLVMEVNSSPGLEGIEGATGIDIAGLIIEHCERGVEEFAHQSLDTGRV